MLVVDFSCGFTDPACALGSDLTAEVEATKRLLDVARAKGLPVIFTSIGFEPSLKDGGLWLQKAPALGDLQLGGRWVEIDPRLEPRGDETVVLKKGASGILRHEPGGDSGLAGCRHGDPLRCDDERLRAGHGRRPPPERLAHARAAGVRGRQGAGSARGEPLRHPGEVRGRGVARRGARLRRERARPRRSRMTHRVAVLAGDGVGPEVVAEARKAVDALGVAIQWTEYPWGSAFFAEHGMMMPPDATEYLRTHDAILMGAIGDPTVPDDVSLWGSILAIRQSLDLWANLRPCRLLTGIPGPLAGRGPETSTFCSCVRTRRGSTPGAGGIAHRGLASEIAVEAAIFTRAAIERVVRHAFELARPAAGSSRARRSRTHRGYGYVLWDEIGDEEALQFPDVRYERVLVDALAARMVRAPDSLDVVVASNLFGDILTDLAAAIQGGMGMAASANLAPGRRASGCSSRCTARRRTSPARASRTRGRGLERGAHARALGEGEAAAALMTALEDVCRDGPRTRDVGGSATTREVGDAIAERVA